jgi:dienelactone hydrolase
MAASFCADALRGAAKKGSRPEKVGGLILLAAYPGAKSSLSAASFPVLSISASEDGLATPGKIEAARKLLPASCRYVTIGGGNHAQFGDYGPQPGDGIASASADLQRKAVVEESLALMDGVLSGLN